MQKVVQREGKYKIGLHNIRKFLHKQDAYSLHKPVRRRFRRNHIIAAGKDDLWMCDLIDMVKFEKWNDGNKYILLMIDVFSKFVWLPSLKIKSGPCVPMAFQDIFEASNRTPSRLLSDKGQEFNAKVVQTLMEKRDIMYFPTQNETKASVSERAIKTIKTKLYRYFNYKDEYSYLPILQSIAYSYNHTYHRTIGMTPASVKDDNEEEARLPTYFAQNPRSNKPNIKLRPFKYKINDYVRISHLKTVFTRAYDETYSGDVFRIYKRYHRGALPIYRLQDLQQEEIKGTFYESELQKIDYDLAQPFKIDKITKTRGKGKAKQHFVQWKYYPKKFNSWIKATDLY